MTSYLRAIAPNLKYKFNFLRLFCPEHDRILSGVYEIYSPQILIDHSPAPHQFPINYFFTENEISAVFQTKVSERVGVHSYHGCQIYSVYNIVTKLRRVLFHL